MTKRDIGAIKMHQDETYVQLSQDALEGFLHNVGPNKTLERGIRISVIEGQPDVSKPSGAPKKSFAERKHGDRKFEGERRPYEDRKPSAERPVRDKPAYAKKSNSVAEDFGATNTKKKFGRKPEFAGAERTFSDRPFADRPSSDRPGKDWAKPSKPNFAGDNDGLKRKKKAKSNAR
jgi:ATP-dependent RNA helicase DeaD